MAEARAEINPPHRLAALAVGRLADRIGSDNAAGAGSRPTRPAGPRFVHLTSATILDRRIRARLPAGVRQSGTGCIEPDDVWRTRGVERGADCRHFDLFTGR